MLANMWRKTFEGLQELRKKMCIFTNFIETELFLNPHQQNIEKKAMRRMWWEK